jgi:hypothetical protein
VTLQHQRQPKPKPEPGKMLGFVEVMAGNLGQQQKILRLYSKTKESGSKTMIKIASNSNYSKDNREQLQNKIRTILLSSPADIPDGKQNTPVLRQCQKSRLS